MRPRSLDEFVGQEHLLGPGKALRRAIEADHLSSAIFWGPPGCGKSTLAWVIARLTRCHFETFSAVTSGVADVRRVTSAAQQRRARQGRRTILFVDELHRFNKAQQDAFLPHVEDGTIVLIGATTENPFFEVNSPLLSRARVYRFQSLAPAEIERILKNAIEDKERGLGNLGVEVSPEAMRHLTDLAGGDARSALNGLELAAMLAAPDEEGKRRVTLELAEEAMQQRALLYDREGDNHYDTISAFIKSMRGSDPDAALYWLARMIAAGEDPRFIARRIVIQAAEDVGNADPMALVLATAAAHAVEYVGMPEAQIPLAQAAVYLATAPKSNASYVGISRALADISQRGPAPVPLHLRDASYRGARALGHGRDYRYPHDFPGGWVEQEYVPPGAMSRPYYEPTDRGFEAEIQRRLERLRRRRDKA
ncbi:MAG: replication-associated recombination protein A [Armatimonadota bacterium]|nr:replication-associated recombination protein A [Armatimonadota bacterium]